MPENIKDDINNVVLNDTAMMKQNSEIDHLINDIKERKRTPRLNYNPVNMSFESDVNRSNAYINKTSLNLNKNE